MIPAFPKPSQIRKTPEAVKTFRDGREVCNLLCKAGRDEYERRKRVMWERQARKCCLCGFKLAWSEAMFEHWDGRGHGGGHRDDRIEKDGLAYNGVAHPKCNSLKGPLRW
jgi:hypothetical protein